MLQRSPRTQINGNLSLFCADFARLRVPVDPDPGAQTLNCSGDFSNTRKQPASQKSQAVVPGSRDGFPFRNRLKLRSKMRLPGHHGLRLGYGTNEAVKPPDG